MPQSKKHPQERFTPASLEDVFAIYLARELEDTSRIRWYVRLTHQYSMCMLSNALRMARRQEDKEKVEPEEFLEALQILLDLEDFV